MYMANTFTLKIHAAHIGDNDDDDENQISSDFLLVISKYLVAGIFFPHHKDFCLHVGF